MRDGRDEKWHVFGLRVVGESISTEESAFFKGSRSKSPTTFHRPEPMTSDVTRPLTNGRGHQGRINHRIDPSSIVGRGFVIEIPRPINPHLSNASRRKGKVSPMEMAKALPELMDGRWI